MAKVLEGAKLLAAEEWKSVEGPSGADQWAAGRLVAGPSGAGRLAADQWAVGPSALDWWRYWAVDW